MVQFLKVPVNGKQKNFENENNSWMELFNFQNSFVIDWHF